MSRLAKKPITIPAGTQVKIENNIIIVKGPKGELKQPLHTQIQVELTPQEIQVNMKNPDNKKERPLWGLFYNLIDNMIIGVNQGFEKKLEINGVGYKASVQGQKLIINVGFSHPVEFILPQGITGKVEANLITVSGIDKQLVGETAAQIRKIKEPEPYKGKGIKYINEVIRRKEGKIAGKA